jgi:radical SAM protein with 4Fe4S-binding SPASM domain
MFPLPLAQQNMNCLPDTELMQKIRQKATAERIPFAGSFELTHRCNLHCQHCYLNSQCQSKNQELTTSQILPIIDTITQAGCLHLLLTGGEPLLRPDFFEIYLYAKKSGLLLKVFTNGTLISDEAVAIFKKYPPRAIEVSIYGATAATYETVTGVAGSFNKCMQGIEKLRALKIPFALKTVLLTLNQHELPAMRQLAQNFGVKFRYDGAIRPRLDGARAPLKFRLQPEAIVVIDFATAKLDAEWLEQDQKYGALPTSKKLYNCGAGKFSFHIDPFGNLMPCMSAVLYKYNLLSGSFQDGWNNYFPKVFAADAPTGFACNKCVNRYLCSFCPAAFFLETGSETEKSQFLCKLGHLRRAHLCKK